MKPTEALDHLTFNIQHNAGHDGIAARTLVDEPSGTYIAVDVCPDDDGGPTVYSCDWETGTVILGVSSDDGGCVESADLEEVAKGLATVMTRLGL
jgi:hypothetical protein